MQFNKIGLISFALVLFCSLFLLFGCTSSSSLCGDNVCSSDESLNCSCFSDCGECSNQKEVDNNFTVVSSIPLSTPVSSSVSEINLAPLLENVNLSQINVPSIDVSGSVELPSKEDYLRILLIDGDGKEHLVFEIYYPLYNLGTSSFENVCNETCNLSNINPEKLRIETNITDFSKIRISSLSVSSGNQVSQKISAVEQINSNLKKNNESWVAGETSVSKLSYAEKKAMYGDGSIAPPAGFEYYSDGVYGVAPLASGTITQTGLPTSWDWRNRHGKNWITSVKNQGTRGLCWAFSSIAAIEATYNIYYNNLYNVDLAEEEFLCGQFNPKVIKEDAEVTAYTSFSNGTEGGYVSQFMSFAKINTLPVESCLPYFSIPDACPNGVSVDCSTVKITNGISLGYSYPCSTQYPFGCVSDANIILHNSCKSKSAILGYAPNCSEPIYKIKDFNKVFDPVSSSKVLSLTELKRKIVTSGPVTIAAIANTFHTPDGQLLSDDTTGHAMLVVGYETDSLGRLILIIKNSWGANWGQNGYLKFYVPAAPKNMYYVIEPYKVGVQTPINCVDDDNDSLCNWGISASMPSTCPTSCIRDVKDCDDSNPGLLGFDANYNCINVNSGSLDVNSTPQKASVYVDNNYRGITPLSLALVAGNHTVIIKKDDFKSFASQVQIVWNQTKTLSTTLERSPNLLWKDIDIIPVGAGKFYYDDGSYNHIRILVDSLTNDSNKETFYFAGAPSSSNSDSIIKNNYTIKYAYVCERSTGASCVSTSLKQITFRTGLTDINVPDGGSVQSDSIEYKLDKSKDYLVLLLVDGYVGAWQDDSTIYSANIDEAKSIEEYVYRTDISQVLNFTPSYKFKKNIMALHKIVGNSSTEECGNLECELNETYSSCPFDCPSSKQCLNSDACCLNNTFKTSGTICEQSSSFEFSCSDKNLLRRSFNKVCTGSSSVCTQRAYSNWDLNTTCSQTCLSDTNTCSNYACWPFGKDQNRITGINVGICKQKIENQKCISGAWSDWNITQAGVVASTEVCDVNLVDEDCDGSANEGCACINGTVSDCNMQNFCKTGKQTCANGAWGACVETGNKATNLSCATGKVCNNLGVCSTIACSLDSQCPNTTGNNCKAAKCNSPGDWNSSCTIQNKTFGTSCGDSNSCNNLGECVQNNCKTNSDCNSQNSCLTGVCQNNVCNFTNKTENTVCPTGKCNANGQCTSIVCSSDSNCANTNPCKLASCTKSGLWNSSCSLTNVTINTSCGTNQKCNALGECKTIACTVDTNCVSANVCQVGVCSSKGDYNASCVFSNKSDTNSCGLSSSCVSGVCKKYSKIIFNSRTFNGPGAPAELKVMGESRVDKNFFGVKTILISSDDQNAVLFDHNFSVNDLNLINVTVEKGELDEKNYLIVHGLDLNGGTKTIYLPKTTDSENNAVCLLDEEVTDANLAKEECSSIICDGDSDSHGYSCSIVNTNLFVISGLNNSFVSEEYVPCGDGQCSADENCSTCRADCGACHSSGSSTITCSTDATCGVSSFIGTKFCSSNNVMQTYRDKNCLNKGTSASRCVTTDSNRLITVCSANQTCINGVCSQLQVQPQLNCTIDSNCLSSEECSSGECQSLICSNGYTAQNHACGCTGTECGSTCYSSSGICCENQWKVGKTTCIVDENAPVVDENKPTSKPPVSEITLLGIPILYIGIGAIIFAVIIILVFTFLPQKAKTV